MKIARIIFLCGFAAVVTIAPYCDAAPTTEGIISHIRREPVPSTAVATIGYSKRLHALEIEFVNGAIYRYLDVPLSVYRGLLAAQSKARFYDENIRGRYHSVHVRPRAE